MTSKDQLLTSLKEKRDDWVSGESLGQKMDMTRSAIWKHIHKLKEEGYVIESSRRKGYSLRDVPEILLKNEIQEGLNTKIIGKRDIYHHRLTDSTNVRAKYLADEGAAEGTVIIAEEQERGRGRRGRSWFSPEGKGIYVSIILRPRLAPSESPKLTLMAAVAVAETLLSLTSLDIRIKWPNDIMIHGRKLAGILTEVSTEMDAVEYVIIGLGLNVNIPYDLFPEDINDTATSIILETGRQFPRIRILKAYLEWLEKYYELFRKSGFDPVLKRWKELADIIGRQVRIDLVNQSHTGEVLNVDEDGVLVLKDSAGTLHRIFSGDVKLLNR
ncbi:MAG: biotin--[acetyl-CoA-carboxylase] ligase [Deltaproteobacteria bacterium]|nr:biotin--[acetyl-CoA-carboxylase] ligase [Deltaproteobacteria bacterium]